MKEDPTPVHNVSSDQNDAVSRQQAIRKQRDLAGKSDIQTNLSTRSKTITTVKALNNGHKINCKSGR